MAIIQPIYYPENIDGEALAMLWIFILVGIPYGIASLFNIYGQELLNREAPASK